MSKKKQVPDTPVLENNPRPASLLVPVWVMGVAAVALIVAGFAGVVAMRQQKPSEPLRLPPEATKPTTAAKPTPAPWTYDSVTNQHWDPNHKHWHKGPPPNQGHGGEAPTSAPDIPNPEPWQYDAASNQHFNPDHGHWHTGPPPTNNTAAPAPPVAVEGTPAPAEEPVAVEEAAVPVEPAQTPEAVPAP